MKVDISERVSSRYEIKIKREDVFSMVWWELVPHIMSLVTGYTLKGFERN
jgi:hypothetical protein